MLKETKNNKPVKSKSKNKNVLRFAKEFMWTHKWYILLMFVALSFIQAYTALIPMFSQYLIDESVLQTESQFAAILLSIGIWLGSLLLLKAIFEFISLYFFMAYQQKIKFELREKILEKTFKLNVEAFDKNNEGYFMSRINKDPNKMSEFAQNVPKNAIEGFVGFAFTISFIFTISWIAGLVGIGVTLITTYITIKRKRKVNANFRKQRAREDELGKQITNDIAGIREIKNYNAYDHSYENIDKSYDKVLVRAIKDAKLMAIWMFSNRFFFSIMTLSFILIGSLAHIYDNMSLGSLTALIMYSTMLQRPINSFLALSDNFNKSTVSIDKYYTFLGQEVEDESSNDLIDTDGSVSFKNLSVSFGEVDVIKNLSLDIKAGEKIAIVGKTGSGKTTLLKMIMKYYKPTDGSIELGNQDIWNHSTKSVRKQVTYMSQDPFISFDTIRNNIMISNEEISDEDYEAAKYKSYSAPFINTLPDKDETMIGPKGITLSGGQRQRLALARVFTKNTPIIIFDEATSNLDNITEKEVKKSIAEFSTDKTIITIAHRLTTIKDAKRIIVMSEGKIVEDGTWDGLIANKAEFYEYVSLISDGGEDE